MRARSPIRLLSSLLFLLVCACSKDDDSKTIAEWWKPKAGVSFDWDLDEVTSSETFTSDVVDVDMFETSAETVAALHAQGKKVIAYISVGTFEEGRPDRDLLPAAVVGEIYPEWPDERWLDIRQIDKLKPWIESRFKLAKEKGFDAIEPDNIDGYGNETGFDISLADTEKFCTYMIDVAHAMGLGIGQKNVGELAETYSDKFDWALTEDAFYQKEEDDMAPYLEKDKPVFATEYTDMMTAEQFNSEVCPKAKTMKYSPVLKNRNLDKPSHFCP